MALIVPSVVRYAMHGTYAGEEIINIADMELITGDRAGDAFNLAGVMLNEWADHILPGLVDDYFFNSVSWVDLDSISGTVGQRSSTAEHTLPETGLATTGGFPANVAGLVTKVAETARNIRNGRWFLVGLPEAISPLNEPNTVAPASVTSFNGALADYLDGVAQVSPYNSRMVVVHTPSAVPPFGTIVTELLLDSQLSSQRDRMPS